MWIRLQANKNLDEKQYIFDKDISMIKELNAALPQPKNTFISFEHINSKPDQWQAFFDTIPDFLTESGVWWKEQETGIEFFDVNNNTASKLNKHHFRSLSILSEEKHLRDIRKICINNKYILIPAKRLKEETDGNVISITNLTTIKYFCHKIPINLSEKKLNDLPDNTNKEKNILISEDSYLPSIDLSVDNKIIT